MVKGPWFNDPGDYLARDVGTSFDAVKQDVLDISLFRTSA